MADVICKDVCLWINHVSCGLMRTALLALEPKSQIWLSVDGVPILFERMNDGSDGRSTRGLRPVGDARSAWLEAYRGGPTVVKIDFIERLLDKGAAASWIAREPQVIVTEG